MIVTGSFLGRQYGRLYKNIDYLLLLEVPDELSFNYFNMLYLYFALYLLLFFDSPLEDLR